MMDIVRTQYFYDSFECGLGSVFRDYIVGEVDRLVDEYSRHCARHKIPFNLGAVGLPVRYLWYNIHR